MSRFLISCGGTGGHLSPGIALAEGLVARGHEATLLISHKKVDARLIAKYPRLRFVRLPGTGFGGNPVALVRSAFRRPTVSFSACARCGGAAGRDRRSAGLRRPASSWRARCWGCRCAARGQPRAGRAIRLLGRLANASYLPRSQPPCARSRAAHGAAGAPRDRAPAAAAARRSSDSIRRPVLAVLGGSRAPRRSTTGPGASCPHWPPRASSFFVSPPRQGHSETLELKPGAALPCGPFSCRFATACRAPVGGGSRGARAGAGTLAELGRCATPAILVPFPHAARSPARQRRLFPSSRRGVVIDQLFSPPCGPRCAT